MYSQPLTVQPEVFILAILLMSWQSFFSLGASNEYEVIEYFAGVGRIARMAAGNGYRAAAFDVVYDDPKYYEGWPKSEKQKK